MKTLVIYDSYFGNTALIAETVAKELNCQHIKVHSFKKEMVNDYDTIIIGSPTRAFSPTKDIKNLVKSIRRLDAVVAIFDTRIDVEKDGPKILRFLVARFGYSNDSIEKMLQKKGIDLALPPGAFYVQDSEGPLGEEELTKAKEWIKPLKEET